jgi:hypothetical protein
MKITAKASGGFAGRTESYELDTTCRPEGKSVESLLDQLDFFRAVPECEVGADIARWEITVADGPRRHTVTLTEENLGTETQWQALLAHLRQGGAA